jgi:hypothetical protein
MQGRDRCADVVAGVSVGARVLGYLSALLFSPFILIFLWMIARGELGTIGASYRQRQRLNHTRKVRPSAPAMPMRIQLGMIYLQQLRKATPITHFRKAIEIDPPRSMRDIG